MSSDASPAPGPDTSDPLEKALQRHTATTNKELAFITVLLGAVYADNKEHDSEAAEVAALLARVKTLKNVTDEQRRKLHHDALHLVNGKETARNDHVKLACQSLLIIQKGNPPAVDPVEGLAESVFAHCCDIVFADMKVTQEEKSFLRMLSEALEIPRARADQIVKLIGLKNDY